MDRIMQDLEKELHIDITYDSKEEIAVIRSMVGSTATYFGVPLSEEIRAEDPEGAVKAKIRKVVGIGRNKTIRNTPVTGRIDHHSGGDRNANRQEEPVSYEASRMGASRMDRDRHDSGSAPERSRVQRKRKEKKMREPSLKDTILIVITVAAFLLALSGAEMLTNMDPHPAAGCACLALGSTWIILIGFVNSAAGREFLEDVKCLK